MHMYVYMWGGRRLEGRPTFAHWKALSMVGSGRSYELPLHQYIRNGCSTDLCVLKCVPGLKIKNPHEYLCEEKTGTPYRGVLLFLLLLIKCAVLPVDWGETVREVPIDNLTVACGPFVWSALPSTSCISWRHSTFSYTLLVYTPKSNRLYYNYVTRYLVIWLSTSIYQSIRNELLFQQRGRGK